MAWTIRHPKRSVMSEEVKPKIVSLETAIPGHEEPTVIVNLVACESGQIYIGRMKGQERWALPLCLDAAKMLHLMEQQAVAELVKEKSLIHVAHDLNGLGLGRRDN